MSGGIGELSLQPGEVQVWMLDREALEGLSQQANATLDGDEVSHSRRLLDPRQAQLWLGRRVALRRLMAAYMGLAPDDLRIQRGGGLKPCLAPGQTGPRFSVSSSGDWMGAAFSQDEVGLDLELVRDDIAWEGLEERFFNEAERGWVARQPNAACRQQGCFQVWTRKEAQLKLRGLGLAGLETLRQAEGLGRCWVEDLTLPLPLVGTLALDRAPAWLKVRRWPAPQAEVPNALKRSTMPGASGPRPMLQSLNSP